MIQQSRTVGGAISADKGVIELLVDGQASAGIQVEGTFVGTLEFEGSINGEDWESLPFKVPSTGVESSSTESEGIFSGPIAGIKRIRVRASAWTSGTANITIVTSMSGSVSTNRTDNATATANTPSIASAATAIAANSSRKGWMIQNLGTNPLFVRMGASASVTVFHAVLKGGTGNDDGLGGSLSQMEGIVYTGIITIAGTSPRYTVTEL